MTVSPVPRRTGSVLPPLALVVVLGLLSGCGCPVPSPSIDVSDAAPVFSWGGGEGYQLVVNGAAGVDWSFQCTTGQNCFTSPLVYGNPPDEVAEIAVANELERGEHTLSVCTLCDDAIECSDPVPFEIE